MDNESSLKLKNNLYFIAKNSSYSYTKGNKNLRIYTSNYGGYITLLDIGDHNDLYIRSMLGLYRGYIHETDHYWVKDKFKAPKGKCKYFYYLHETKVRFSFTAAKKVDGYTKIHNFINNLLENLNQKTFSSKTAKKLYPKSDTITYSTPKSFTKAYIQHVMTYSYEFYNQFIQNRYFYNFKKANQLKGSTGKEKKLHHYKKIYATAEKSALRLKKLIASFYHYVSTDRLKNALSVQSITIKDVSYNDTNHNFKIDFNSYILLPLPNNGFYIKNTEKSGNNLNDALEFKIYFGKHITNIDVIEKHIRMAVKNTNSITKPIGTAYKKMVPLVTH